MSDQHQTLLQVDAVSDETPVGLCQQVGASEEAVPSQITNQCSRQCCGHQCAGHIIPTSWDSGTHTALPVMARLGHPQHLLFPLLMLCVSAAVLWEDEDASHTSCLPPYICYLEDESPFMTLSYFPLS